jgi:very-short-patch-repair endonuclease
MRQGSGMPRRIPLPETLRGRAFTTTTAQELGLGRGRLAGADLERPFHRIRTSGVLSRVDAYAPLLRPGDRFSHTTAAALWGAPLPREFDDRLHVSAPPGARAPRSRGVIGHEASGPTASRRNLPVSAPGAMFLECARLLDLDDLVAVGDHLVLEPRQLDPADCRPHLGRADLLSLVTRSTGRGVVRAREAARLVRPGVESPMETRLRLLLIGAGLPEPLCGYALRSPRGTHIGFFDLAWPERRVIAEYDGDQHRTSSRQYDRDITRFDRAAEAGWTVVRVRARGVLRAPADTVARVRRALAR